MDTAIVQALQQMLQQMTQLLATAGGGDDPNAAPGTSPPGSIPPAGGMPPQTDDGGMGQPPDGEADGAPMGDDPGMPPDASGGGGTLHDRVSSLESHTGLKKATGTPLILRIESLEEHWLGETYMGKAEERVSQLENVLNLTKSAVQQESTPESQMRAEIDALKQQIQQLTKSASGLPSVADLRSVTPTINQKRSQSTATDDADLIKAAESWGYSPDELDEPFTLGDLLLAQFHANKHGLPVFGDDDD
ncbi:MAG: hypothetical protein LRZ84_14380 [Desertifilum sp.]|nr:hypothetical protein [Desertifilum sp.]